jgi:hypothetical protein
MNLSGPDIQQTQWQVIDLFIRLFIGAVVLSLGYKLYEAWLEATPSPEVASDTSE